MEKFGLNNQDKPKKKNTLGYVAALFAAGAGGVALNNAYNGHDTHEITTADARVVTEDEMREETGVRESLVNESGEKVIDLFQIDSFNGHLSAALHRLSFEGRGPIEAHLATARNLLVSYDELSENEKEALFKAGTKSLQLIAAMIGVPEGTEVDWRAEFEERIY